MAAEDAKCGWQMRTGEPCRMPKPCSVHTAAWLRQCECRGMTDNDKKCGWPTRAGAPCTQPMPCQWHAQAKERAAREAGPKCDRPRRSGEPCGMPKPCRVHDEMEGMKQCASTLDASPFERCAMKCAMGVLFCDAHAPFPDLGRKAAMYGDSCKRRRVEPTLAEFMAVSYPGAMDTPAVHDLARYVEAMRTKMST